MWPQNRATSGFNVLASSTLHVLGFTISSHGWSPKLLPQPAAGSSPKRQLLGGPLRWRRSLSTWSSPSWRCSRCFGCWRLGGHRAADGEATARGAMTQVATRDPQGSHASCWLIMSCSRPRPLVDPVVVISGTSCLPSMLAWLVSRGRFTWLTMLLFDLIGNNACWSSLNHIWTLRSVTSIDRYSPLTTAAWLA